MNPLIDEKIVSVIKSILPEFMTSTIKLQAHHEAYGPTKNEGLCYESVNKIEFQGDLNGSLYFCMDGFTKLILLPLIANWRDERFKGSIDGENLINEFTKEFNLYLDDELENAGYKANFSKPINLSHKLIPIDADEFRQFILIFFLRDRVNKEYCGRLYIVLTLAKSNLPNFQKDSD